MYGFGMTGRDIKAHREKSYAIVYLDKEQTEREKLYEEHLRGPGSELCRRKGRLVALDSRERRGQVLDGCPERDQEPGVENILIACIEGLSGRYTPVPESSCASSIWFVILLNWYRTRISKKSVPT
jgi:hypothetical protein